MGRDSASLSGRLESWSQPLFLAGGVLVALYGVSLALDAGTSMSYPTVGAFLAGTGGTLAFLGLLGLYDRYADDRPWTTRIAALATLVGAIGFGVLSVVSAGELLGLVSTPPEQGPGFVFPLVTVGMIVGFTLFGFADYQTSSGSNRLTLLLLAPAAVFAVIVATGAAGLTERWISAALGMLHGLSYLGVWMGLRGAVAATGTAEAAADSAA